MPFHYWQQVLNENSACLYFKWIEVSTARSRGKAELHSSARAHSRARRWSDPKVRQRPRLQRTDPDFDGHPQDIHN